MLEIHIGPREKWCALPRAGLLEWWTVLLGADMHLRGGRLSASTAALLAEFRRRPVRRQDVEGIALASVLQRHAAPGKTPPEMVRNLRELLMWAPPARLSGGISDQDWGDVRHVAASLLYPEVCEPSLRHALQIAWQLDHHGEPRARAQA